MNLIVNAIKYQWGKRNSVTEINMEKKLKREKNNHWKLFWWQRRWCWRQRWNELNICFRLAWRFLSHSLVSFFFKYVEHISDLLWCLRQKKSWLQTRVTTETERKTINLLNETFLYFQILLHCFADVFHTYTYVKNIFCKMIFFDKGKKTTNVVCTRMQITIPGKHTSHCGKIARLSKNHINAVIAMQRMSYFIVWQLKSLPVCCSNFSPSFFLFRWLTG